MEKMEVCASAPPAAPLCDSRRVRAASRFEIQYAPLRVAQPCAQRTSRRDPTSPDPPHHSRDPNCRGRSALNVDPKHGSRLSRSALGLILTTVYLLLRPFVRRSRRTLPHSHTPTVPARGVVRTDTHMARSCGRHKQARRSIFSQPRSLHSRRSAHAPTAMARPGPEKLCILHFASHR